MMKYISVKSLQAQLQKRWSIPYYWGKKQNNDDDACTNFIYHTPFFERVSQKISLLSSPLQNYAWNRWYNFWSAQSIENSFCTHSSFQRERDKTHRTTDFFWNGVPFDHKTSVFPKRFPHSFMFAKQNPHILVEWLYKNQSTQNRLHYENRFFVVLYSHSHPDHWKLKAELLNLHHTITHFLETFTLEQGVSFVHRGERKHAGVLFFEAL